MGTSQRRVPPENRAGDAGTMLNSIQANLGVAHNGLCGSGRTTRKAH